MHERQSVLVDTGDLSAPMGSSEWTKAVHFEAKAALNDNNATRELVERWVGALRKDNHFRNLTDSKGRRYLLWSSFCKDRQPWGLGYCEQAIDAILLERGEREAKASAEEAQPAKQRGAPEGNRNAAKSDSTEDLPLMRAAKGNNSTVGRIVSSTSTVGKRGTNTQERLTSRIARDRPDILERMKAGEFKSVRKAALEAGIVKPEFAVPLEPKAAAKRIVKRIKGEELLVLIRELANWAGVEIKEGQDDRC